MHLLLLLERQVQEQRERFTDYRSTRIMVCSWNIDACSPENLNGEDDALLRKWLESMDDPDLIVIGLQEIVDLESKRQTASTCTLHIIPFYLFMYCCLTYIPFMSCYRIDAL